MNNGYKEVAEAIKRAEEALETLKNFTDIEHKAKGNTMREQIANYIVEKLSNAGYMCCGFGTTNLSLSYQYDKFVFKVRGSIISEYPIFSINYDGKVEMIRELDESMMMFVIHEWEAFKKELDTFIRITMNAKKDSINKKLAHIAHVNEQLEKWHV